MRTKTLLLTAALTAAGALSSMAQVYSVNIVGYINLTVPKGFSIIGNQLNATPDNTLPSVLPAPPENTTIYKFNGTGFASSNFSADNPTGGWFPNTMTLAPGEAAFISIDPSVAPSGATLTLVGEVKLLSDVSVPNGFSMISSALPMSDTLENLGFPTREGDYVYFFDPTLAGGKGGFKSSNYSADNPTGGWFPFVPTPAVGQGFYVSGDAGIGPARTWHRSFVVGPP
jgi:hypothetical protein